MQYEISLALFASRTLFSLVFNLGPLAPPGPTTPELLSNSVEILILVPLSEQDFSILLAEPHKVPVSLFLLPVQVFLDGSTAL